MGRENTVLGQGVLQNSGGNRFRHARIAAGLLILGVLIANVFAAAITFTGTTSLGVGAATIAGCDTDGIKVSPVSDYAASPSPGFYVTVVSIGSGTDSSGNIDANCEGKTIEGVVLGSSGSIGTISATAIVTGAATTGQALTIDSATTLSAADIVEFIFEIAD